MTIFRRYKIWIPIGFLLLAVACRKKDFDLTEVNPNTPSVVAPDYVLSAALKTSASLVQGGDEDFANTWMGYWGVYGITSSSVLTYNITNDYFSANWDDTYLTLENYKYIEDQSTDPENAYYRAIAKIMTAFHFQRLVDMYNNIPYTKALDAKDPAPAFDKSSDIYPDLLTQLDSAKLIIGSADLSIVINPGGNDIMFQGDMDKWTRFANTLKLKMLMRETELPGGPASIQTGLSGITLADLLGEGEDATVNPGYTNASHDQQSPKWQDVGYATNGSPSGNNQAYRANSYAVAFYNSTGDTDRMKLFFAPNDAGIIRGRAFGSSDLGQSNPVISGIGSGILKSPGMDAIILPAFESLFLQAEAVQRGYLQGDVTALFHSAVTESFRLLGVEDYAAAATALYSRPDNRTNISVSADKLKTIIIQKWAALDAIDPLESYSDWRRLGIPTDLPVSVYTGTTAKHIPYRLLYPTSEFQYNAKNVNAEGAIDQFTSKIFWMP